MDSGSSIARRAAIAMALTIGFYSLAIVLGLGTILLPFVLAYVTGHLIIKLLIVCLITGVTILSAIWPRKDQFEPPGPQLQLEKHPNLLTMLKRLAEKTGQNIPKRVFVIPEFNAWVAERGGSSGYGGERMMGIGLPLLHAMTITQVEAVLAHEFGHYHHGDTRLGPRIYKTRAALARTITELEDRESWLQAPFKWYGMKFLEITHGISRHQEFNADRLAVEIAGKSAMTGALRQLGEKALAYDLYLQREYLPLIQARQLPPLLEGFVRFLQSEEVKAELALVTKEELEHGEASKYDTHPSLRERLSAIESLPDSAVSEDTTSGMELLSQPEQFENQLVRGLIGEHDFASAQRISWDDDINTARVAGWEAAVKEFAPQFQTTRPVDLIAFVNDPTPYVRPLMEKFGLNTQAAPYVANRLVGVLGAALAHLLVNRGWQMHRKLGESPRFVKDAFEVSPFDVIADLASKKMAESEWIDLCKQSGISNELLFQTSTGRS